MCNNRASQHIKLKARSGQYLFWRRTCIWRISIEWRISRTSTGKTHPMRRRKFQHPAYALLLQLEVVLVRLWTLVLWRHTYNCLSRNRYIIITHVHSTDVLKMSVAGYLLSRVNHQHIYSFMSQNICNSKLTRYFIPLIKLYTTVQPELQFITGKSTTNIGHLVRCKQLNLNSKNFLSLEVIQVTTTHSAFPHNGNKAPPNPCDHPPNAPWHLKDSRTTPDKYCNKLVRIFSNR